MRSKRMLNVGIIGLGVGEQHIAGYLRHPACSVVAVCDIADKKRVMAQAKYPDVRVTADADEILTDPKIDVVSIASYDNYHYEHIVKGLSNGKHLFVEKPLCLHQHELEHIQALLQDRPHLKISSNLILRMSPRFRDLKCRIQKGELGTLYYIEADYHYGRIHKIHHGWRGSIPYYSVVLGGAVHMVDLLLWLTGDSVAEVAAVGTNIGSKGSCFKYNDTVVAILRCKSGMVAKVVANFPCVHPHFHALSVYGTKGSFINGTDHALLYTSHSAGTIPEVISTLYPGVHKGDLIYSFIEAILNDTEPEVSSNDVFRVMAVCFAIEQAARNGTVTSVCSVGEFNDGTHNTVWQADYRRGRKTGRA
ncbi:MAG: Gfo/Idh/MocA family oxidoreductase [Desulfobacterota bacterium]|nr:Gfo/Idh/MocA family oxidoreductase [Thermodesulfobacteriota bacterium]